MQIIHKNLTSVLHEIHTVSVTKTSQLIMFREITVFLCENNMNWRIGTYSYHSGLKECLHFRFHLTGTETRKL